MILFVFSLTKEIIYMLLMYIELLLREKCQNFLKRFHHIILIIMLKILVSILLHLWTFKEFINKKVNNKFGANQFAINVSNK